MLDDSTNNACLERDLKSRVLISRDVRPIACVYSSIMGVWPQIPNNIWGPAGKDCKQLRAIDS